MKGQTEIWKAHPDIPGIEVSTFGNVRTLDRLVSTEKRTQFVKGRVLKQFVIVNGYMGVVIIIDGKRINKYVHRLVAQTFIPNPDNLPEVNHEDCNRASNNVENLEWCTRSYNMKYKDKFGISNTESQGHPLLAINLKTLEVLHFRSQGEASRVLGIQQPNINAVIKGRLKQTGGYRFENADAE